jgi:hypothetical protein
MLFAPFSALFLVVCFYFIELNQIPGSKRPRSGALSLSWAERTGAAFGIGEAWSGLG